jgi:hypothetical protein
LIILARKIKVPHSKFLEKNHISTDTFTVFACNTQHSTEQDIPSLLITTTNSPATIPADLSGNNQNLMTTKNILSHTELLYYALPTVFVLTLSPLGPFSPGSPRSPLLPGTPLSPGAPGVPDIPGSPFGPGLPGLPRVDPKPDPKNDSCILCKIHIYIHYLKHK